MGSSVELPRARRGLHLLSIPELCQKLEMGKSWVYRRLRSGEIPIVKLGRSIKVERRNLKEILREQAPTYLSANNRS